MKITCLRHPALPEAWTGRFLGQMDPRSVPFELKSSFTSRLASESYTKIFSSDLVRCSELAHFIQGNYLSNLKLTEDTRIREISFGLWEGKTYQEISEIEEWKDQYKLFIQEFPKYAAPEAESNQEFHKRISDFLNELHKSSHKEDNVLIVTHAGVIRQFASIVLGIELGTTFSMQLNYLSMNQFIIEKDFTSLVTWNEDWNLGAS